MYCYNAVLNSKESLRIIPCNIAFSLKPTLPVYLYNLCHSQDGGDNTFIFSVRPHVNETPRGDGLPQNVRIVGCYRVLSRVFEEQKLSYKMPSFLPPPPSQILSSLQYISNYIGKIIQTQRGQCT